MSTIALAWEQFRLERKMFWRNPSAAFFNFLLPLLLLVLTATAFNVADEDLDVLIPGVAGMGVLATTFTSLAFNLTWLRDDGVLKRIRGTPMPPAAYVAGLIGASALNAILQVAIVVAIGNLVYSVDWPQEPALLVLFTVLGVVCFSALGVAFSHLIPNKDAAPAYTNAEALPLKHLIDGLSKAIVGGGGDAATAAAVVGAWAVCGIVMAVRFFRWE